MHWVGAKYWSGGTNWSGDEKQVSWQDQRITESQTNIAGKNEEQGEGWTVTRFNSENRKLKSDAMRTANSKMIQKQQIMILEVCSSGAFDVLDVKQQMCWGIQWER